MQILQTLAEDKRLEDKVRRLETKMIGDEIIHSHQCGDYARSITEMSPSFDLNLLTLD
jgi:hypothetical protein